MTQSGLIGSIDEEWTIEVKKLLSCQSEKQPHYFMIWITPNENIELKVDFYTNSSGSQVLQISVEEDLLTRYSSFTVKICDLSLLQERTDLFFENKQRTYSSGTWIPSNIFKRNVIQSALVVGAKCPDSFKINEKQATRVRLTMHYEIMKSCLNGAVFQETPHAITKTGYEPFGFQALDDFESMFNDSCTSDVIVTAALGLKESFYCHKFILAARSRVFRAMFRIPMREKHESVIVVEDMDGQTMKNFLSFLYCGRFQDQTWIECLPSLTNAAEKYAVSSLKQFCDLNLYKCVTCSNAIAIGDFAVRHDLKTAIRHVRSYMEKNAKNLTLDWQTSLNELKVGN